MYVHVVFTRAVSIMLQNLPIMLFGIVTICNRYTGFNATPQSIVLLII